MSRNGSSYSFLVEWYDPYSTEIRRYTLLYHTGSQSVEMHDNKLHKLFLKPTKIEHIKLSDFYLGGSVTIFSRTLRIIGFADEFTRRSLECNSERCLVLIKPDVVCKAGEILAQLEEEGFRLINIKMVCLNSSELTKLMGGTNESTKYPYILKDVVEKLTVVVELMCNNAIEHIREVISRGTANNCSQLLADTQLVLLSKDAESTAVQVEHIFSNPGGPAFRGQPRLKGTTLAVIKPHAVTGGLTGRIWNAIQENGFCTTAVRLFRLSKVDAAEFLEVYKGVVNEYPEMLDEMASGPCVAMEIARTDGNEDVQQLFREFVGPADPEIARFLHPETLRAKFGIDKVRNAVHCTDLPEDAELEVNFFFRVLDK